ncbi:MAG TPA: hypothetical protein VGB71_19440 [Flavisolibacter sp.]|jgi:hypothetical protein
MTLTKRPYSVFQLASAVLMIVALLWLTISTPFVYASQQEFAKHQKVVDNTADLGCSEEESGNPLGNTTEEKKPTGGNSLSEEYLHHHHIEDLFISPISQVHKSENAGVYNAFHGEVQVPPPNVA